VSKKDAAYNAKLKHANPLDLMFGGEDSAFSELDSVQTTSDSQTSNTIASEQIKLDPNQPRRYFDPKKLEELAQSIKELGILEPLLVRPLNDGYYELIAGERRFKAAGIAGLSEVPCVVKEMDDDTVKQVQLIENLQREDLNAYEETVGILELLARLLKKNQNEVISLLNRMEKANRKKADNVIRHDSKKQADNVIRIADIEIVNNVFASIGRLSPESFRANRLPLLNLPGDIQQALASGTIEYTKARAVARVKSESQRLQLLDETINQNLSLTQIKELIQGLESSKQKEISPEKAASQRVANIGKQLKEAKVWDDAKKFKKLEKLLGDIEKLLGET
jgi:ParB family chromosome partitioning protein